MTTNTYLFDGGIVVEHVIEDTDAGFRHMLVVGGIASEWASWGYLSHLKIGDRLFIGCVDGRALFGECCEIINGSPI